MGAWPARLLAVLWASLGCPASGQFGGGFGGGGYDPPPPVCPNFQCAKGEKAVGKVKDDLWSYGCKESGISFLNTASFDPNNPLGGMQQKNVDKCCLERDICKQTCGMTSVQCAQNFKKCSAKTCKGDRNCDMAAMMSEIMSEPMEDREAEGKDYDYKCGAYNKWQKNSCRCVAESAYQGAVESKLKSFYGDYNAEKLDASGEIKDLDEVWKKWKGKEPEMFLALATKYKDKALTRKEKPNPPPYDPKKYEKADKDKDAAEEEPVEEPTVEAKAPAPEPPAPEPSPEDVMFETKRTELIEKKRKAAEDEDYDAAEQYKEEVEALTKEEVERLKAVKTKAIDNEEYQEAKLLKKRIQKLEEL